MICCSNFLELSSPWWAVIIHPDSSYVLLTQLSVLRLDDSGKLM